MRDESVLWIGHNRRSSMGQSLLAQVAATVPPIHLPPRVYDKQAQLHPNHVSARARRSGLSRNAVSPELAHTITQRYRDWLLETEHES